MPLRPYSIDMHYTIYNYLECYRRGIWNDGDSKSSDIESIARSDSEPSFAIKRQLDMPVDL